MNAGGSGGATGAGAPGLGGAGAAGSGGAGSVGVLACEAPLAAVSLVARGTSVEGPSGCTIVVAHGALAACVAGSQAVVFYDVSEPDRPRLLGSLLSAGTPRGLALSDGRAYVAEGYAGLAIYDLANPAQPELLGRVEVSEDGVGEAYSVAVSGSAAYVGVYQLGLAIVDVSNARAPRLVTRNAGPDTAPIVLPTGLVHHNGTLFVADNRPMVYAFEASGQGLAFLSSLETQDRAYALTIIGDYLAVADSEKGVVLMGAKPEELAPLGQLATEDRAWSVARMGRRLVVGDGSGGVVLASVDDPREPTVLAREAAGNGAIFGVATTGCLVLAGHGGFSVFEAR
jgi:hypothetical protein